MRILTFLALILSFNSTAHADAYDNALSETCSAFASNSIADLKDQSRFTSNEQIALICDALKEISNRYIQTTVRSFDAVFEEKTKECLSSVEQQSVDSWEMNSLLKSCYATFEDGHLEIALKNIPIVFLPFKIKEIDGRFFISKTGYSICNDSDFKVGDEIISIGGESLEFIKDNLKGYISASSDGARDSLATDFVTGRNFLVPVVGETELIVSRNNIILTYKKNWRYYDEELSEENREYLKERSFQACMPETEINHRGYHPFENLYTEARSRFFYTDLEQTNIMLTISRPKIEGYRACYLKFATFSFNDVYHQSQKVDLWDVLEGFVNTCSEQGAPFVLDLRANNGGYMSNMTKFVQLFTSDQIVEIAKNVLYSRLSLSGEERIKCYGVHPNKFSLDVHAEKFFEAFCRYFEIKPRTPEGYLGQVYVLSSEDCFSACEYAVNFLNTEKSIITVGTPTHGAMLLTSEIAISSDFRKPYEYRIFDMAPYYFVGADEDDNSQALVCFDDGSACLKQFEGVGVNPTEPYKTIYRDLVSLPAGAGWRDKIESMIAADTLKQVP